jgi:hypothetical protein
MSPRIEALVTIPSSICQGGVGGRGDEQVLLQGILFTDSRKGWRYRGASTVRNIFNVDEKQALDLSSSALLSSAGKLASHRLGSIT